MFLKLKIGYNYTGVKMERILKLVLAVCFFLCSHTVLMAQLTHGTTGLLNAPSAEMQDSKTVMLGGNFLNKEITPATWNYNTYNYYLNFTVFPFLEVAYTATMFKAKTIGVGNLTDPEKFCNQDRYFSARLRVLKEGQFWKHMPSVVIGTSDPYTESGDGEVASTEGNGYFCRFYLAATKHFLLGKERLGIHVSYVYNRRIDRNLNGIAAGITFTPSVLPNLRLIAEYDNIDYSVGASYLLSDQVHMQLMLQDMKYLTAGLCYKMHLK